MPLAILALCGLAISFWLSSRYPALNQKAMMGADTPLSGLSFDIVVRLFPDNGFVWEIFANTVNWINTNLKGMTFGVLFGSMLLTLLSLIKKRSFKNGFANAALGTAIGAPLGVCVNCAAPIALGMHAGRMRLETTLSALLASPTLNIIVITMSFAMLPFYLATIKLVMALIMVLIAIPLLCKFFLKEETLASTNTPANMADAANNGGFAGWILRTLAPKEADPTPHNLIQSVIWFIRSYARNFFFVFIITVPMMFLAALLGALVASITKPNELVSLLPIANIVTVTLTIIVIAMIASFVPAPIALDVILVAILVGIGLKAHYAVAMVIGLGSYSIYAFIILWRAISLRTAVYMWILVILFAVAGGIVGRFAGKAEAKYDVQQRLAILATKEPIKWPVPPKLSEPKSANEINAMLTAKISETSPLTATIESSANSNIAVTFNNIVQPTGQPMQDDTYFARMMGTEIGLDDIGVISPLKIFSPYNMHGGIAAGDIQDDGWMDILTIRSIHRNGMSLYINVGGKFVRQKMNLGPYENIEYRNVALVDINGDKKLDIIASTQDKEIYAFFNMNGEFDHKNSTQIDNKNSKFAVGMAFADYDNDGDIDIVLGNWGKPAEHERGNMIADAAHNNIAWNNGNGTFTTERLPGIAGATLTTLASDVNRDGNIDIIIGDDVRRTDKILLSDGKGGFTVKAYKESLFPYTMRSSMSYAEGDWNNDLIPDYYGGQVAQAELGQENDTNNQIGAMAYTICAEYTADLGTWEYDANSCAERLLSMDFIDRSNMRRGNTGCAKSVYPEDQMLCATMQFIKDGYRKDKTGDNPKKYDKCMETLAHIPEVQKYCYIITQPRQPIPFKYSLAGDETAAIDDTNILMTGLADGSFEDKAVEQGVANPGWTWNAKFTDFDQDGWQDIFIMTGIWQKPTLSDSNVLFQNRAGKFSNATKEFGMTDHTPAFSYTSIDYDRDGDIDIIRDTGSLRMIVHRNDRPAGKALWVHLRDDIGNSFGIGAAVTICTDGETTIRPGKCQMRKILASGGFLSFDPIAAHFGLGTAKSISLISVTWPNGEVTNITPKQLSSGDVFIRRR